MSNQFPPPPHDPQGNPQPGLPSYTGPAQDPAYGNGYGYGYGPVAPQSMPGMVRAAQIVVWVLSGLVLLGTIAIAASGDSQTAGAAFGANICLLVTCGFAFAFQNAGNGVRVTCIVLMSVQIALGLGGLASGNPGGLIGLLGSIATVILLSQGGAGAWFKRPRTL
ncbi:hypothetical protein M4V62_16650 [Streptomyces durmitorensis]|uniref:Integral membrane protein n=1 Tax=Streptomyces durmitorensis TaxID=319947 RepID=A0ABY4PS67_9ACTN|nr:hypothetical protein [Streptomyces durmitorensis]UQT56596.1 hypothetical protein M4V62_16650 [Streptomyces durmitorensis]